MFYWFWNRKKIVCKSRTAMTYTLAHFGFEKFMKTVKKKTKQQKVKNRLHTPAAVDPHATFYFHFANFWPPQLRQSNFGEFFCFVFEKEGIKKYCYFHSTFFRCYFLNNCTCRCVCKRSCHMPHMYRCTCMWVCVYGRRAYSSQKANGHFSPLHSLSRQIHCPDGVCHATYPFTFYFFNIGSSYPCVSHSYVASEISNVFVAASDFPFFFPLLFYIYFYFFFSISFSFAFTLG